MSLSQEELSNTLKHLKRAPAPRIPVGSSGGSNQIGQIDLGAIKLKKTGKRESLIEEDSMALSHHEKENNQDELNSILKRRIKQFDHEEDMQETKHSSLPRVMPKPKFRRTSEESDDDRDFKAHESFSGSGENRDSIHNIVPKMKPLPSLQSIGKKPPPKPTKPLILAMKVQKHYKNHKVIIAPKVQPAAEAVENKRNEDESIKEEGEDIYDDICSAEDTPQIPTRPQPTPPREPEPIEDMYDDVEQLAETVKAELKGHPAPTDTEPIMEDFYDDCNPTQQSTSAGRITTDNTDGKEYGEELYEGVETFNDDDQDDIEEINEGNERKQVQPSPVPQSNKEEDSKKKEKERKEREKKEKELQRKKEREEQRRRKEEEKQEREKKKKEEEERRKREKFDKDLKKVHKLKGNEDIIAKGTTKEDFFGTGKELPCSKGAILEVIVKENCPNGKWLVKNNQGHLGYVPSAILEIETDESNENLDEDLYECVDTFKNNQPPASSIPPPIPADDGDDVYDDTLIEDEDLYDDIPGADM